MLAVWPCRKQRSPTGRSVRARVGCGAQQGRGDPGAAGRSVLGPANLYDRADVERDDDPHLRGLM
jgi:hypothetical protein